MIRRLAAVLLAAAWVVLPAAAAFAEESPAPEASRTAKDAAAPPLTTVQIEKWVTRDRDRMLLLLGLRYVPLLVGVVLVAFWYHRRAEVRRGTLPPPAPVEPTQVFGKPLRAFAVALAVVGAGILAVSAALRLDPSLKDSPIIQFAPTLAIMLPLACVVVLRRARSGNPPAVRRGGAVLAGLAGYCIAMLAVVPAAMAAVLVAKLLGTGDEVQPLVNDFVRSPDDARVWAILVFGVLFAPALEETIFRGMLYPAAKGLAGGGLRGAWIAAFVVSAVFSAMHGHALSALPLFVLSMSLCWVFQRTNALLAVFTLHALNNAMTFATLVWMRLDP